MSSIVCKSTSENADSAPERKNGFCDTRSTRVVPSGGGLFLWVELPEGVDTMEMFDFVFQKNIAYVPGQFFCTDGSGKNAMRLNFSTASEEMIAKNIPILGEMIAKYLEK